ncbi:CHAD domain-containing protein [Rhodococcus sp. NPDC060090]|uniref:CYTH and CHAD domain-containing protein n=1 Tax=Rhodococcus sp. NPDC060090 TaxID=3347056 RepID=UPI0036668123
MTPAKSTTSTSEETERKYSAAPDQKLPDLSGIAGVASVDVDAVDLSAQYFDTSDLKLLRSKITLRRREGGDDAGWHSKLPAGSDTRTELHHPFATDGPSDVVPDALLGLLRGVCRNRPVALAALLNTRRHRHRLRGNDGALLAEVVVDEVTAIRSVDDAEPQWREIEVELGPGADASILDAVEELLATEGITRSPSPSKVHRVLGDLIPDPEHIRGTAGYLRDYLARERQTLLMSDIAVRRDAPDAVHSMRKAARRIRSALQTYADDFAIDTALVEELRWLGRCLSPSRDLEVQHERLADRVAEIDVEQFREATRARIDEYFTAKSVAARAEAITTLDSDRYLAMVDSLDTLIGELSSTPQKRDKRHRPKPAKLAGSIESLAKKVSKRVNRVAEAPDAAERDERMHRARKGSKRLRYAIEVIVPLHPKRAEHALDRFDEFQDLLGEFQDSVVARDHLLDLASEQGHSAESSFGLGVLHQLETEIGAQQAVHLESAWKKAYKSARTLWR